MRSTALSLFLTFALVMPLRAQPATGLSEVLPQEHEQQDGSGRSNQENASNSPAASAMPQTNRPAAAADSPRAMLHLMQIDDSLLEQFLDGRSIENEQEPLLRLLFRMPAFSQVDLDRWSTTLPQVETDDALCQQHRFEFFKLQGMVESIEQQTVIPELVQRLGFSSYFRVTLSHDERSSMVVVRELPKAWRAVWESGVAIRQPIAVEGMLIKHGPVQDQDRLVLVAPRVHWFPNEALEDLGVSEDLVRLAQLGIDIATLADVQHRTTMRQEDRESFYQILNALHHAKFAPLAKLGRQTFDIGRMIREPEGVTGEIYALEGLARRALRIEVDDADIQARFGMDHYFEVEVFMPMERSVRFVNEDQDARVFRDYPFVFCVPELPPGMPLGDDIRVPVQTAGVFLKLWSYRTEFMSQVRTRDDRPAQQLSPLLLGPTVLPVQTTPPDKPQLSLGVAVVFLTTLGVIWLLLWRAGIQDRHRSQQLFQKNRPPDASFENLRDS